jgi:hypothetical protein
MVAHGRAARQGSRTRPSDWPVHKSGNFWTTGTISTGPARQKAPPQFGYPQRERFGRARTAPRGTKQSMASSHWLPVSGRLFVLSTVSAHGQRTLTSVGYCSSNLAPTSVPRSNRRWRWSALAGANQCRSRARRCYAACTSRWPRQAKDRLQTISHHARPAQGRHWQNAPVTSTKEPAMPEHLRARHALRAPIRPRRAPSVHLRECRSSLGSCPLKASELVCRDLPCGRRHRPRGPARRRDSLARRGGQSFRAGGRALLAGHRVLQRALRTRSSRLA